MTHRRVAVVCASFSLAALLLSAQTTTAPEKVFGYSDFAAQARTDQSFLAVPSAQLAGEELKTLTAEPHIAASPEDYKTATYTAVL